MPGVFKQLLQEVHENLQEDITQRMRSISHPRDLELLRTHPGILSNNEQYFLDMLRFVQNCKVIVGKPRVHRSRNKSSNAYLEYKGRYVLPNIVLTDGVKKIIIEKLDDVHSRKATGYGSSTFEWYFPDICREWDIGFIPSGPFDPFYYGKTQSLVRAFEQDAGSNWTNITQQVDNAWQDVQSKLAEIVDLSLATSSHLEREKVREDLNQFFRKSPGMVDVPPEAILDVMKLGYKQIMELANFASKHKADLAIIEVEDIKSVQQETQVRHVMES